MLSIPDTLNIKTDLTPLQYQRAYGYSADTFFFRCNHGHLGKYNLPVSSFKGFEGTVKQRLRCTRVGCNFYQWIFLEEWVYQDEEAIEEVEEFYFILVDNQYNELTDNQGNLIIEAPIPTT
jgi:hypothetical protein